MYLIRDGMGEVREGEKSIFRTLKFLLNMDYPQKYHAFKFFFLSSSKNFSVLIIILEYLAPHFFLMICSFFSEYVCSKYVLL